MVAWEATILAWITPDSSNTAISQATSMVLKPPLRVWWWDSQLLQDCSTATDTTQLSIRSAWVTKCPCARLASMNTYSRASQALWRQIYSATYNQLTLRLMSRCFGCNRCSLRSRISSRWSSRWRIFRTRPRCRCSYSRTKYSKAPIIWRTGTLSSFKIYLKVKKNYT